MLNNSPKIRLVLFLSALLLIASSAFAQGADSIAEPDIILEPEIIGIEEPDNYSNEKVAEESPKGNLGDQVEYPDAEVVEGLFETSGEPETKANKEPVDGGVEEAVNEETQEMALEEESDVSGEAITGEVLDEAKDVKTGDGYIPLHPIPDKVKLAEPPLNTRFDDRGDGTVLDKETSLIWTKDANIMKSRIHLQGASDYINKMNKGELENLGYTDWRIPSVTELGSIIDDKKYYPALPEWHGFLNVQNDFYWTSTGGFNIVGYAWMVDLASGVVKYDYLSYCSYLYLWPVRGEGRNLDVDDIKPSPSELDMTIGSLACDDLQGPMDPPGGVTATAVSSREISLVWSRPNYKEEIAWYNVYEDGNFLISVPGQTATFKGLTPGTTKCYQVSAYSSAGRESKKSSKACDTTWLKPARGTVWSAGYNKYGQLGDGTSDDSSKLKKAEGISDVKRIAAGIEHVVALKSDGTVWAWGRNQKGQLGDGTRNDSLNPVQVKGLSDVVEVDAGWYHSLALKSDGTVWAWGRNYYGQLGDGSIIDTATPVQVKGLTGVVSIAAGWYHSLALDSNRNVWAWGWNIKGQLGNDSTENSLLPTLVIGLTRVDKIAAGMYHSVAMKTEGTVWTWGSNEYGQLGTGNTVDSLLPVLLKDISNAVSVSAGMHHTIALLSDGSVLAWGRNEYGQLGIADLPYSSKPMQVEGITGAKMIDAGAYHSTALLSDGTVWVWGWDYGGKKRKAPPTMLSGLSGINMITSGRHFTSVLKGD